MLNNRLKKQTPYMLFSIAFIVFMLDQLTKIWALKALTLHTPLFMTSFFNFFLTYNKGVSFSLFYNTAKYGHFLLAGMGLVICCCVLYWMIKEKDNKTKIGLSFVLGGALANILDRVRLGHVVDFLDFHFNSYHWPAFNLADSFICLGAFIIFIQIFLKKEEEQK